MWQGNMTKNHLCKFIDIADKLLVTAALVGLVGMGKLTVVFL